MTRIKSTIAHRWHDSPDTILSDEALEQIAVKAVGHPVVDEDGSETGIVHGAWVEGDSVVAWIDVEFPEDHIKPGDISCRLDGVKS